MTRSQIWWESARTQLTQSMARRRETRDDKRNNSRKQASYMLKGTRNVLTRDISAKIVK